MSRVEIAETQWSDRRHPGDIISLFRLMEMWCIAWEDEHTAARISTEHVGVEAVSEADVEYAGYDGVDPVFRLPMRHQFDAARQSDPDHMGARLGRLTDEYDEKRLGGKARN